MPTSQLRSWFTASAYAGSSAQHHREWVIKRKAEIVAEERRKETERRRLERKRRVSGGCSLRPSASERRKRFARTSRPFDSANRRSAIPSLQWNFNSGRSGRSAKRIELILSSPVASERFKTTIEARQPRLILERRWRTVRRLPGLGAIAVSVRGTLGGLTQFGTQFGLPAQPLACDY